MAEAPHITIGHHPGAGVMAAPSHDHHVAGHLLRRVGFEPVPGSRFYALVEPGRDPVRRTQLAVQSLRAARQTVHADAASDLRPGECPPPPGGPSQEPNRAADSAQQRRAQAASAVSPTGTGTAAAQVGPLSEGTHRPGPAAVRQPVPRR